ncbi:sugar phosphate isomerase/epimerase family protein [Parapedobacter indicus]|uniref:Sugar phosphate isomerase/epimerase n=1 Tax=Parapedobacter indicus TaxID=1477437 RepID=A0A1I3U760_9SPHI|nr:sugar phosphate isomerase/epimerase family protein [Parapedobacter indicus]PPK99183.1 sugar phosphate isomerase/epimerase [Parapedobacter indicus]SFJ78840.1 Sugar phosphate isomerase/epimerase [Parapedobacter indicus]
MNNINVYTRRTLLKGLAALAGLAAVNIPWLTAAARNKRRYRIGACDWSIGKQSDVDALALANTLGLDGVQVSLGTVQNGMHLRRKDVQQTYLKAVAANGVEISSLAIGELNNVPYKSEPETEEWVRDSIHVAKAMECRVVLLAFFSKGDIKGDEAGIAEVIRRLKKVAPIAEQADVILGIESWLSADELLAIIDKIGSTHVRVYYDVANATEMGYDIYREMKQLGSKYICEVHAKENGALLGQGKIDFQKVYDTLDEIGYEGWVILEGGVPAGMDVKEAYLANTRYIRSVFS